ncbi:MAG: hypothetical protein R3F34_04070 [Planctomycetota bacterium]
MSKRLLFLTLATLLVVAVAALATTDDGGAAVVRTSERGAAESDDGGLPEVELAGAAVEGSSGRSDAHREVAPHASSVGPRWSDLVAPVDAATGEVVRGVHLALFGLDGSRADVELDAAADVTRLRDDTLGVLLCESHAPRPFRPYELVRSHDVPARVPMLRTETVRVVYEPETQEERVTATLEPVVEADPSGARTSAAGEVPVIDDAAQIARCVETFLGEPVAAVRSWAVKLVLDSALARDAIALDAAPLPMLDGSDPSGAGVTVFRGVPVGGAYRLRFECASRLEVDPAREPGSNLTAPLLVPTPSRESGVRSVHVRVEPGVTIVGAFPSDAADATLMIRQLEWEGIERPPDTHSARGVGAPWEFREERTRAGTFAVGGAWTGGDGVRNFVSRTVALRAGEVRDIGVFDASTAQVLEIVPELVVDGTVVDVAEKPEFAGTNWAFRMEGLEAPFDRAQPFGRPRTRLEPHRIAVSFDRTVARSIEITPYGIRLPDAVLDHATPERAQETIVVTPQSGTSVRLPIRIDVGSTCTAHVVVPPETGESPVTVQVYVSAVRAEDGACSAFAVDDHFLAESDFSVDARRVLGPGTWTLYAAARADDYSQENVVRDGATDLLVGATFCGRAETTVQLGAPCDVTIRLEPAAIAVLHRSAVTTEDKPAFTYRIVPSGEPDALGDVWYGWSRSDDRSAIGGLLPNTRYRVVEHGPRVHDRRGGNGDYDRVMLARRSSTLVALAAVLVAATCAFLFLRDDGADAAAAGGDGSRPRRSTSRCSTSRLAEDAPTTAGSAATEVAAATTGGRTGPAVVRWADLLRPVDAVTFRTGARSPPRARRRGRRTAAHRARPGGRRRRSRRRRAVCRRLRRARPALLLPGSARTRRRTRQPAAPPRGARRDRLCAGVRAARVPSTRHGRAGVRRRHGRSRRATPRSPPDPAAHDRRRRRRPVVAAPSGTLVPQARRGRRALRARRRTLRSVLRRALLRRGRRRRCVGRAAARRRRTRGDSAVVDPARRSRTDPRRRVRATGVRARDDVAASRARTRRGAPR